MSKKVLLYRYVPSAGLGLLMYATVRLLNDTVSGMRFWQRPWGLTLFEMGVSVLLGIGLTALSRRVLRSFVRREPLPTPPGQQLVREVLVVAGLTELLVNAVFLPLAAFTDDGLSWGDAVAISVVPLLFVLMYYGWIRSRHYLRAALNRQLQVERLTHEQTRTELQLLRAQYHPHFLFNALNTIYFQMDEDVPAAQRSLEQLSTLLRYQLYDQQQPVPIRQELDYLRDYLALQQVRRSDQLCLRVDLDPRLDGQQLYPLLLLPLLENAFKYVGGTSELAVCAHLTPTGLRFRVRNSVAATVPSPPLAGSSGLGLANLRRRLQLLYPQRHELRTERHATHFEADLHLFLT